MVDHGRVEQAQVQRSVHEKPRNRINRRLVHDGLREGKSDFVREHAPFEPMTEEHPQAFRRLVLASPIDELPIVGIKGIGLHDRIVLYRMGEE